jgi:ATP-dependent protease ClpP protease subunit
MSTFHEQLLQAWRDNPHLAYAFADFTHFKQAASVHRIEGTKALLNLGGTFAEDAAESAELAAKRIRLVRSPARPAPSAKVVERVGNRLVIWLYGQIGPAPASCSAETICAALREHNGVPAILVRIASAGGSADDAGRIAYELNEHKARTVAIVDKFAFSAASIIASSCDRVLMRADAVWMMHRTHVTVTGNVERLQRAIRELNYYDIQAARIYSRKRRIWVSDARERMEACEYLSAIQAKNAGLVDQIIPALPIEWGAVPEYRDE